MTEEQFVELIQRLEREAVAHPTRYRWKVVALGALGYAFIGSLVLAALALLVGMFVAYRIRHEVGAILYQLALVAITFLYAVVRSLRVEFDPPQGIRLDEERLPRLFAEVAEIGRKLGMQGPHQILVNDQLNAAMSQYPHLGMFRPSYDSLILGLPYLHAVTLEEARTTIAHEFGHMAGAHGRAGAWVYRVRKTWSQLLERLEAEKRWFAAPFRPFFRWHAPYFNAYSFVLARLQEYEADRQSVLAADARAAADDLLRMVFAANAWKGYWDGIWARAADSPVPDVRPFSQLTSQVFAAPEGAKALEQLETGLRAQAGYGDTHPSLRERLAALGETARVPPPVTRSAAQELLGESAADLARQLDEAWEARVSAGWKRRFDYVAQRRSALAALEEKRSRALLEGKEAFEHALLVEELHGGDEALPLQRSIVEREPEHTGANLELGRMLLERGDETGLAYLEKAIHLDQVAILPAWKMGWEFLQRAGRQAEAESWLARGREFGARMEAARKERSSIPFHGQYVPHGLSDPALSALRASIARHRDVRRAWLVRRRLEHFDAEQPQWVLCAERRGWGLLDLGADSEARDRELVSRLRHVDFTGNVRILVINRLRRARRIFEGVAGAQIYG